MQIPGERPSQRPDRHLVQFYDAEPSILIDNVATFVEDGLRAGESVLVIAAPEHVDAFLGALGKNRTAHEPRSRLLTVLDARATLDEFMVDGRPDWRLFEQTVGGAVRGLRRANPEGGLRAYGEMVGLLWTDGMTEAAVQLENFWNVLLGGDDFTLFCGYPVDIFGDEFTAAHVHDVLCSHSHVVSAGAAASIESALERAIEEVLGAGGAASHEIAASRHDAWAVTPTAEATILWLRSRRPEHVDEVLARARDYYRGVA